MNRTQIASVLVSMLVLLALAPATLAQLEEHVAFRREMEQLNREGTLSNPLMFLQLSCADGSPWGPEHSGDVLAAGIARRRQDMR